MYSFFLLKLEFFFSFQVFNQVSISLESKSKSSKTKKLSLHFESSCHDFLGKFDHQITICSRSLGDFIHQTLTISKGKMFGNFQDSIACLCIFEIDWISELWFKIFLSWFHKSQANQGWDNQSVIAKARILVLFPIVWQAFSKADCFSFSGLAFTFSIQLISSGEKELFNVELLIFKKLIIIYYII